MTTLMESKIFFDSIKHPLLPSENTSNFHQVTWFACSLLVIRSIPCRVWLESAVHFDNDIGVSIAAINWSFIPPEFQYR